MSHLDHPGGEPNMASPKLLTMACSECGAETLVLGKPQRALARRGRAYCSVECKKAFTSRVASERMARTNRRYAAPRMRSKNPMRSPAARARMRTAVRVRGWQPPPQGDFTAPQLLLASVLAWDMGISVATGTTDEQGDPVIYQVGIGNLDLHVAIDVVGSGQATSTPQIADVARELWLLHLGWRILRFRSEAVVGNLAGCVQAVLATIRSR